MAVFWVVTPCSLVGKLLPDYTALQPRTQPSSYSPSREPQILHNLICIINTIFNFGLRDFWNTPSKLTTQEAACSCWSSTIDRDLWNLPANNWISVVPFPTSKATGEKRYPTFWHLVDIYQSLLYIHSSQSSSELHVSAQCGHHQVQEHMFKIIALG
jgi:hypothetical protein